MSGKLLLFGGAVEGREILEYGIPAICCVATAYGAKMLKDIENAEIRVGRLNSEEIASLIKKLGITCVIDATHPYAVAATANIKCACAETCVPLKRVMRASASYGDSIIVDSCADAARVLNEFSGKILLTTGSKDLTQFTVIKDFSERLFIRLLPCEEAIDKAKALGFKKEHIITGQGPFSAEENEELLLRTGAEIIVTKDGGIKGGIKEKLSAAERLGIKVIVIARPSDDGCTVKQAVFWTRRIMGLSRPPLFPMHIDIEKEKAVVAGGGEVAFRRASALKQCGADVTVIAPRLLPGFENGGYKITKRRYCEGDLEGAKIAVAATDDREVNNLIEAEAKRHGALVNVADLAENCDFYFPSIKEENGITVSVSSAGLSPKLTKIVSHKLCNILPKIIEEAKAEIIVAGEGAREQ